MRFIHRVLVPPTSHISLSLSRIQLMEERQKNHILENTLLEYQDELRESYKIIIGLR